MGDNLNPPSDPTDASGWGRFVLLVAMTGLAVISALAAIAGIAIKAGNRGASILGLPTTGEATDEVSGESDGPVVQLGA